jgi:hypothetical protein
MKLLRIALAWLLLSGPVFAQAQLGAGQVWGNSTAAKAPGRSENVTAILDRALGSAQGSLIERGAAGWGVIVSNGAGADPSYQGLGVLGGGTGINIYAVGDIICASGTTTLSRVADIATGNALISGGVGACPSYGKITSSFLNITTTTCTNQYVTAISATGTGTCSTITLAGASFANQGTTTTVLHGNAAGNPAFGAVVSADLSITTTTCTNQFVTAISAGGVGTCTTDVLASAQHANQGTTTTVLHGNGAGNPAFGAVSLTADVSQILPIANGGTNSAGGAVLKTNIQVFAGSGTYTPTTGILYAIVTCYGGGGGGGGTANTAANIGAGGAGGGSGSRSIKNVSAATIGASQTVTIGGAGAAGTSGNNAGGAGGDTSLGALCIGKGGTGGGGSAGSGFATPGAGGISGTGDITGIGQSGLSMPAFTGGQGLGGAGGSNDLWAGAASASSSTTTTGNACTGRASGGGGGASFNAGGAAAGGVGCAGFVFVTEYLNQ